MSSSILSLQSCSIVLQSDKKSKTKFFCTVFVCFQLATGFASGVNPWTQCCKPLPVPEFQSCAAIKEYWPDSPSAEYHLPRGRAYCHMDELCGTKGGWTRIAYWDMFDPYYRSSCPSGLKMYQSGEVRACGRPVSSGGSCASVKFSSLGVSYSQVCGRVVGYQYGSPDAVYNEHDSNHSDINSYYVDGVSITHGYPRQHIWTFVCGFRSSTSPYRSFICPCSQGSTQSVQSFIGNDYFCESGNPNSNWEQNLYVEDPLWDGKGCGTNEATCCSATGLPWFNNVLNSTTTDYIELRVCGDEGTVNEDVPVSFYEIYIK